MISETIVVAIISLVGTLAGAFAGVMTSSHLTGYRIEQLEKKVEKHNNLVERVYRLEDNDKLIEQKIDGLSRRIGG